MTTTVTRNGPSPTREELLRRASELVPVLKERAAQTEHMRQLPSETVRDFVDAGLIRVGVPDRYGGLGIEYDAMFEMAWELGRGCGASAWCYALWTVHAMLAGYFPAEGQAEFFASGPNTLASSAFNPMGKKAAPVQGGYRVSGHWEFSSGSDASSWAELGAMTPNGMIWMLIPRANYEIVDNWFVSGLSGSGSKDIVIKDAFVPSYRVLTPDTAGNGDWNGWELHRQARYHVPLRCLLGWDLLAPLIGMVRGCIDEFIATARERSGPAGRAVDSPAMQIRLAEASAEVAAAQSLLLSDLREMLGRGAHGDRFTDLDRARYQRDRAFGTKLCLQAVNRLFEASGGHAIFQSAPIQRFFRDAQAATHRETMLLDVAGQTYGRMILGGS
ncbi:MAG TPA: acyl-CoA dehydrogenase family protein [Dehalococcoidia bacterium]|nr:acyl-CoA dehydrogenase family protein [Dehalococcoidia bacterium]